MPVYNRAWCVAEAIASVLALPEDLELVVVEDGSTDATPAIVAEFAARVPGRVRVATHPGAANRGIARSRNLGLAQARGCYVAFLDSDDLYLPQRFGHALAWLDRHPDAAACIEPTVLRDAPGQPEQLLNPLGPVPAADCGWLDAMLFANSFWNMAGITARRGALRDFGGFDERLRVGEEVALWLKLAAAGAVGLAQDHSPVAVIRRHAANSWAGADSWTERSVYLHVLDDLCRWTARRPDVPRRALALARQRLRQSLVELVLDDSIPKHRRAAAWTRLACRHPAAALDRRVASNFGRMVLGLRLWK
jgi:glycosyltransferase involved in cell wall biosynthesis